MAQYNVCENNFVVEESEEIIDIIVHDRLLLLKKWIQEKNMDVEQFVDHCVISSIDKLKETHLNECLKGKQMIQFIKENINKPLTLAVMYGSLKIIQYMILYATKMNLKDLITVLIIGSYVGNISEEKENRIISIIQFSERLNSNINLRDMIMNSYFYRLKPLEFSILLGRKNIISLLLSIKGIYKTEEHSFGALSLGTFDFKAYSPFDKHSRYFLSPLKLLTLTDITSLENLQNYNFKFHPLIPIWLNEIKKRNIIFVILNMVATFFILAGYLLFLAPSHYMLIYTLNFNASFNNKSLNKIPGSGRNFCHETFNNNEYKLPDSFNNWINTINISDNLPTALLSMLFISKYVSEVIIMLWVYIKNHTLVATILQTIEIGSGNSHARLKPYFALYLKTSILILNIFISSIFSIQDRNIGNYNIHRMIMFDFLSILMAGLLIFDFLYQLSIVPYIGPVIQRLLRSFSLFIGMSILYFGTLVVFGTLFFDMMPCLRFKQYIKSSSILSSWIAVFHLTLNIIDFPDEEFERLWMLQLMLVLVLPFFMLNFIITVINEEVSIVAQHCDSFDKLYIINYYYNSDAIFYFPPIRWIMMRIKYCQPNEFQILFKNVA